MHALVEWIAEEKVSTISLTRVKEPRKGLNEYAVGEIVKASCHGFPGVHTAKILAIKGTICISDYTSSIFCIILSTTFI